MRLFIFKSEPQPTLRAFAADPDGQNLPKQFSPWHAVGVVREDKEPPHNFKRVTIEEGVGSAGYQLWRMKPPGEKAKKASSK